MIKKIRLMCIFLITILFIISSIGSGVISTVNKEEIELENNTILNSSRYNLLKHLNQHLEIPKNQLEKKVKQGMDWFDYSMGMDNGSLLKEFISQF